jgi:hypothetical protein
VIAARGKSVIADMFALVLRVEVEQLVSKLPRAIIRASPHSTRVGQRLMLTLGEPGLDRAGQDRRLRVVRAGIAAYREICSVLHGSLLDPYPPHTVLQEWASAVHALNVELGRLVEGDGSFT